MGDVSALAVFVEGLLGFFSPCVLPLVPLYAAYLAGNIAVSNEGLKGHRMRLFVNTLCFVAGIAATFFLLGLAATGVGQLFGAHKDLLVRVGGALIIAFGVVQIASQATDGILAREHRLPIDVSRMAMNPFTAFLVGFVFSFAWTPCVGPALASVLVMAGSAQSQTAGIALVGLYTLGFSIPFLLVGLLADSVVAFFSAHRSVVRVTALVGGALLVVIGLGMVFGWTQDASRYFAQLGSEPTSAEESASDVTSQEDADKSGASGESAATSDDAGDTDAAATSDVVPSVDFTLEDQVGRTHQLSDYRGKVVFLNFWTTWCTYCKVEMPDMQELYEDTGRNQGNVVVLGVANPSSDEQPHAADVGLDEVVAFLEDGGYTYPTLMDMTGEVFSSYGVAAYPTTYVINKEGNVSSYYPGAMSREAMDSLIAKAMSE